MKTMIWCIALLGVLPCVGVAQDISGEWEGVLLQDDGGLRRQYYFSLYLEQHGEQVTGMSRIAYTDQPKLYGKLQVQGTFKNKVLLLEDVRISESTLGEGGVWCLKKARLQFSFERSTLCLKGTWAGVSAADGTPCAPGSITLCKLVAVAGR